MKRISILPLAAILLVSAIHASPAFACTSEKEKEETLKAADFKKADTDQNGSLDISEYFKSMVEPVPEGRRTNIMTLLDKNKDHKITIEEYNPWAGNMWFPKCRGYVSPSHEKPAMRPVFHTNIPKDTPLIGLPTLPSDNPNLKVKEGPPPLILEKPVKQ